MSTPNQKDQTCTGRPGNPEPGSETIVCRLIETATNTNPVDSRGSRLGQKEVVPFVHVPLLFVVVVVAVREVSQHLQGAGCIGPSPMLQGKP